MSSTKVYSTGEGAVAGGRRSTRPPWIWKRPFAAITDHLPLRRPFDARWASNRLDLIRIGPSGAGGGGTAVGGEAPGNRSTAPSHLVVGTIPETGGNPLFLKRGGLQRRRVTSYGGELPGRPNIGAFWDAPFRPNQRPPPARSEQRRVVLRVVEQGLEPRTSLPLNAVRFARSQANEVPSMNIGGQERHTTADRIRQEPWSECSLDPHRPQRAVLHVLN